MHLSCLVIVLELAAVGPSRLVPSHTMPLAGAYVAAAVIVEALFSHVAGVLVPLLHFLMTVLISHSWKQLQLEEEWKRFHRAS